MLGGGWGGGNFSFSQIKIKFYVQRVRRKEMSNRQSKILNHASVFDDKKIISFLFIDEERERKKHKRKSIIALTFVRILVLDTSRILSSSIDDDRKQSCAE